MSLVEPRYGYGDVQLNRYDGSTRSAIAFDLGILDRRVNCIEILASNNGSQNWNYLVDPMPVHGEAVAEVAGIHPSSPNTQIPCEMVYNYVTLFTGYWFLHARVNVCLEKGRFVLITLYLPKVVATPGTAHVIYGVMPAIGH